MGIKEIRFCVYFWNIFPLLSRSLSLSLAAKYNQREVAFFSFLGSFYFLKFSKEETEEIDEEKSRRLCSISLLFCSSLFVCFKSQTLDSLLFLFVFLSFCNYLFIERERDEIRDLGRERCIISWPSLLTGTLWRCWRLT